MFLLRYMAKHKSLANLVINSKQEYQFKHCMVFVLPEYSIALLSTMLLL